MANEADIKRAAELLRLAAEYIIEEWPDGQIDYDDTTCDGYCLASDCEAIADSLHPKDDD